MSAFLILHCSSYLCDFGLCGKGLGTIEIKNHPELHLYDLLSYDIMNL